MIFVKFQWKNVKTFFEYRLTSRKLYKLKFPLISISYIEYGPDECRTYGAQMYVLFLHWRFLIITIRYKNTRYEYIKVRNRRKF